jgi:dienelactone hydrolase
LVLDSGEVPDHIVELVGDGACCGRGQLAVQVESEQDELTGSAHFYSKLLEPWYLNKIAQNYEVLLCLQKNFDIPGTVQCTLECWK